MSQRNLPSNASTPNRQHWGDLDAKKLVVVGDGLAAGMGDFSLNALYQDYSFPALLAQKIGTPLPQPVIQEPGLGNPPGFDRVNVSAPTLFQTTVFREFPEALPGNLSIPGFTVCDALDYRPSTPLNAPGKPTRTLANLILGFPGVLSEDSGFPTQAEAAAELNPTLLILQLGYDEVLNCAINGDSVLPNPPQFESDFRRLLEQLNTCRAQMVICTIPNPLDSGFFSSIEAAAEVLRVDSSLLTRFYELGPGDYVTAQGLIEIGCQIESRIFKRLPKAHVIVADRAAEIGAFCEEANASVIKLADSVGPVFRLDEVFTRIATDAIPVGHRMITGGYLGGFFALNGMYPGHLGNGIIANKMLEAFNQLFGSSFPPLDLAALLQGDPAGNLHPAAGELWSFEQLSPAFAPEDDDEDWAPEPAGIYDNSIDFDHPLDEPLSLPPTLQQILPLNPEISYHGDGMRIVNAPTEAQSHFGDTSNLLFGGLAFFGSQLNGDIHIKFTEPIDNISSFNLSFGGGELVAEDSILECPHLYRFPIKQARVTYPANTVCTGDLDLRTGLAFNMYFYLNFENTGLTLLSEMNPTFPFLPIAFTDVQIAFPQIYSSAFARFTQRSDGQLDFTFHGTSIVPLGARILYPLPFRGATGPHAAVIANGTALHPNIHLSTREPDEIVENFRPLDIPENTTLELTCSTRTTSFGDKFTLNSPLLGVAHGRSPLSGRIQIQFGTRFGDYVCFASSLLPPAGLFDDPDLNPLQYLFPARLSRGLLGYDEVLKFPKRSYYLDNVYLLEDPFELALGAVNVKTGQVIGDLLHRGFIGQNVIFGLLRVEPRTPQGSFHFRGPAQFDQAGNGRLLFRFSGSLLIPYPESFLFPLPDLATGVPIGPDSKLDPFMELEAFEDFQGQQTAFRGGHSNMVASTGSTFTYIYEIPQAPGRRARFRFVNHGLADKTFEMFPHGLVHVSVTDTTLDGAGGPNTLSFTGYGSWSTAPGESVAATVQIVQRPEFYISILIGGGLVDNITTDPAPEIKVLI